MMDEKTGCTHTGPHTEACLAAATVRWTDELLCISREMGSPCPTPLDALAYALHALARASGFVPNAAEYTELLNMYRDTLDEQIAHRYNVEFNAIVTA